MSMGEILPTAEDLEALQRSNQRRLAEYQAQGVNVNLQPAPGLLVELLIETFVGPQGSPEWVAFITAYEVRVAAMLDEIAPQVARAKLMAAFAPQPPSRQPMPLMRP